MNRITFLAVLLTVVVASYGQNLLVNGNLESWNYQTEIKDWDDENVFRVIDDDAYEGSFAARIKGSGFIEQFIEADNFSESGNYIAEGWYKPEVKEDGSKKMGVAELVIISPNHDGVAIPQRVVLDDKYSEWNKFSINVNVLGYFSISYKLEQRHFASIDDFVFTFDDLKFYKEGTLSTSKKDEVEFRLFPNPTKSSVEIGVAQKGAVTISVFNVMGEKVVVTTQKVLDCSNFKSGVYFVGVTQNDKTSVKKLVVK